MSDKNVKITLGSNGFCGLLTILFIGLKLTHYIDWSWWWVLCPLWIPVAFTIAVFALCFSFVVIGAFVVFIYELCFKRPKGRIF